MPNGRGRALAALLLAAALPAGCATATPTPHAGRQTITPVLTARSQPSPQQRTARLLDHLLAGVTMPPGADARTTAPVRELRHPATSEVSSNLVDRRTWWVVPAPVSQVLRHVKRHAPHGCRFDGSGSSSGPNQPTVHDIFCSAPSTVYAADVVVAVEALATRDGSAVRADAQALWIPRRPAYSQVRDPSSAHVVVERGGRPGRRGLPTVRRHPDASGAARLAVALDRLAVMPPAVTSCPAGFARLDDQLRFATPAGPVTVTVSLSGCPAVRVSVPRHRDVVLTGAATLDAAVRHVLHLPARYEVA